MNIATRPANAFDALDTAELMVSEPYSRVAYAGATLRQSAPNLSDVVALEARMLRAYVGAS